MKLNNNEVKEILEEKVSTQAPAILNKVAQPVQTGVPQKQPQQPVQVHKIPNGDSSYHSDSVNMVMDLFEGKFIE